MTTHITWDDFWAMARESDASDEYPEIAEWLKTRSKNVQLEVIAAAPADFIAMAKPFLSAAVTVELYMRNRRATRSNR